MKISTWTLLLACCTMSLAYSKTLAKDDNTNLAEQGLLFFKGTMPEALEVSKQKNKPIMIVVSTGWCSYCKKMKKNTFTDKVAADYINTTFINIEIDAEKGDGVSIARKYQVSSYPTIIFIDKNEKVLLFSEGYLKPDGLIESGKMAMNNLKQ